MKNAKAYDVTISINFKSYSPHGEYDNNTLETFFLKNLAEDIRDGWITRSQCNIEMRQIEEVSFNNIDKQPYPWEGVTD